MRASCDSIETATVPLSVFIVVTKEKVDDKVIHRTDVRVH